MIVRNKYMYMHNETKKKMANHKINVTCACFKHKVMQLAILIGCSCWLWSLLLRPHWSLAFKILSKTDKVLIPRWPHRSARDDGIRWALPIPYLPCPMPPTTSAHLGEKTTGFIKGKTVGFVSKSFCVTKIWLPQGMHAHSHCLYPLVCSSRLIDACGLQPCSCDLIHTCWLGLIEFI